MNLDLGLVGYVKDHLTIVDDQEAWREILGVIAKEFIERYLVEASRKESWLMRAGECSHWVRPHQSRWTVAGEFALPIGYKGASSWSNGLPDFDWSVILAFDGERWRRVDRFSGKRQVVLRIAVPSRTAKHKQAAVHTVWSTSHEPTFYGFRNVHGVWRCVAASDEHKRGRILGTKENCLGS